VTKAIIIVLTTFFAQFVSGQDGTIYPLDNPPEPRAIPLGTGGVADQSASETWFRQWGDPMARNITTATLTPFFPKPGKQTALRSLLLPVVDSDGSPWVTKAGKLLKPWQNKV